MPLFLLPSLAESGKFPPSLLTFVKPTSTELKPCGRRKAFKPPASHASVYLIVAACPQRDQKQGVEGRAQRLL
jgi:hypothetical protein